jgi:hypothetical protein
VKTLTPKNSLRSGLFSLVLVAIATSSMLSGCAFFCKIPQDPKGQEYCDRCFIEDEQFILADKLYSQLGSILLVDRHLCEVEQWKRCEINEALYRLRKVHGLP